MDPVLEAGQWDCGEAELDGTHASAPPCKRPRYTAKDGQGVG